MGRCPKCGSTQIDQYRMPYGAMWCRECGFRVEDKNAIPNPFIEAMDQSGTDPSKNQNPQRDQ